MNIFHLPSRFSSTDRSVLSTSTNLVAMLLLVSMGLVGCDSSGGNSGPSDFQGIEVESSVDLGDSVSGELEGSDAQLGDLEDTEDDGTHIDLYELDLGDDETVDIDMTSEEIDTVLLLFERNGELVTGDDDGGDGLNSEITTGLDEGKYIIVANGFSTDDLGDYELSVD